MPVINTNSLALIATNALTANERAMQKTMQSLSTGSRINNSSDDAAGLAIRNNMTAQINGLNAAIRNANDGINMLQTADGALGGISDMMQRMRELGTLAQNDTYSTAQKKSMDEEYQALVTQIDQVAANTQWNKMNILTGSGGEVGLGSAFTFQIGANAGQVISVTIANQAIVSGTGTGANAGQFGTLSTTSITTGQYASAAVSRLDDALSTLNANRSKIGAAVNRLEHAINNLANVAQNTTDSRSRVADTDYSKATSDLARQQILQQAGTAMLAQANQQPSTVLALLR
jgi:flagellin